MLRSGSSGRGSFVREAAFAGGQCPTWVLDGGLILRTHGSVWLSPVHVAWPGEGRGGRLVAVGVPVPAPRYGSLTHLTTHGEVGRETA